VCKRGEVLEVDCKVRGANIRCGLEARDGEVVFGGGGDCGTSLQYYQTKKKKEKRSIPLLYHCLIGQSFILLPCKQIQFFLQILLSEVVAP
jgi:hypothetical protein